MTTWRDRRSAVFEMKAAESGRELRPRMTQLKVKLRGSATSMTTSEAENSMSDATPARAFISYAWSTPAHQAWVIDLAQRLMHDGIEVVLDRWDLKPGHDAHAFMEQMVTDPTVTKVIMVCDRTYAEKADGRSGGVGIESQIISPELYGKTTQDKYAAVITEVDPDGKPYIPVFYRGRIYFSFETADRFETAYEELLRWLANKPQFVKPKLGILPAHIASGAAVSSAVAARARRAEDALRNDRPTAIGALREFVETLKSELAQIKPSEEPETVRGDNVMAGFAQARPFIRNFQDVALAVLRYAPSPGAADELFRGLEVLTDVMVRPEAYGRFSDEDQDVQKLAVGEMFLTTIALALREERFDVALRGVSRTYVTLDEHPVQRSAVDFRTFQRDAPSLKRRMSALGQDRSEPRAVLYHDDYQGHALSLEDLMQAELILFLRSRLKGRRGDSYSFWYPETLVYANRRSHPLALFARAESAEVFAKLAPILGVPSVEAFQGFIAALEADPQRNLHSGFFRPSLPKLTNADYLATMV
jgi:hypothetical protein